MLKNSRQNVQFNNNLSINQKNLIIQNTNLKQQLKLAHFTINKLKTQIQDLKKYIQYLINQKNQAIQTISQKKIDTSPLSHKKKSNKSNKSLKLVKQFNEIQNFTSQSQSDTQQYHYQHSNKIIHTLGKDKNKYNFQDKKQINMYMFDQQKNLSGIQLKGKVSNQKSLRKIDSSKLIINSYQDKQEKKFNQSAIKNKNIVFNSNTNFTNSKITNNSNTNNFNHLTRSQKLIPISHRQLTSAIKQQGRAEQPKQQQIFKKVSIAKPIYDVFFVTGINKNNEPIILYNYPKQSQHFQPILSLCYSQDFLKNRQIVSQQNIMLKNTGLKIKQFYMIPLRKMQPNSIKQNQREYLIIAQSQEIIFNEKQQILVTFQRMYCFITSCKFFNSFKDLINQFFNKINNAKQHNKNSKNYYIQTQYKQLLHQLLEQPLLILSQKSADLNHTLNYRLDSSISISIDIPSLENSFKLINQYRPHSVLNYKVQIKSSDQCISNLQTKLFGIVLIYALSQKKVILFSNIKSKISQCIIHFLQIIKPLQYVCPVIMTNLKQQHQEYFSAPMSLIIGLWTQQKKVQRQKIQIFMNKKQNLAGMIEKAKMQIFDGIIINLDTGLIYGNGIDQNLNRIALQLNHYYQNYCNYPKEIYKLFQKILQSQNIIQQELFDLQQNIKKILQGTQLYTYYKEKNQNANF